MSSTSSHDLVNFLRAVLSTIAVFPVNFGKYLPGNLKRLAPLLDLIYELFLYAVVLHIVLLNLISIILFYNKAKFEYTVNCLMQAVVYFWTFVIKFYFRRMRHKELNELLEVINSKIKMRSNYGLTYVTMDEGIKLTSFRIRCFVYIACLGIFLWTLIPMVQEKWTLMIDYWIPFDYKRTFYYELVIFSQFLGQVQVSMAFTGSAGVYTASTLISCAQFDILGCDLKNLIATVYLHLGVNQYDLKKLRQLQVIADSEINQYYCAKEQKHQDDDLLAFSSSISHRPVNFSQGFAYEFRNCVLHHRFIKESLMKLEQFYSFFFLGKTAEMISVLCSIAFLIVKIPSVASFQFWILVQYTSLILWDIFNVCYCGEMVNVYSQRCSQAILRSPWYLHMTEFKKDFIFFLMHAQRPFRLTAGKLYYCDLARYRAIITSAFSYLTFLQQMDLRED